MNTFLLERFCNHPQMGVFGTLITPTSIYNTVEQPWADNQPFKSCIPTGIYTLKAFNSPKYGQTFVIVGGTLAATEAEVRQNPDKKRWACLLHSANRARELQGCIAPGLSLGSIDSEWSVKNSTLAMRQILEDMHDGDQLIVSWKDNT